MRKVQFGLGPFLDLYEDGHPPEKESEEERRRYRCGLTSKSGCCGVGGVRQEGNSTVDTSTFEDAFQTWLEHFKEKNKKGVDEQEEDGDGDGDKAMLDSPFKAFPSGRDAFVIDISAGPLITDCRTVQPKIQADGSLLNDVTRSVDGTDATKPISISFWRRFPLYAKHAIGGGILLCFILVLTNI